MMILSKVFVDKSSRSLDPLSAADEDQHAGVPLAEAASALRAGSGVLLISPAPFASVPLPSSGRCRCARVCRMPQKLIPNPS